MTKDELVNRKRVVELLKGMHINSKRMILLELESLQHEQVTKLATHVDPHQIYRAQGALKAYQTVIELFDVQDDM